MAIAYHPKFEYVAVEVDGDVYIVARDLLKATAETCGWAEPQVVATFPGARLEGAVFRHPFLERDSLGILADHVTLEQGTGAVHTAPGHGQEDYVVARKYGINTYCPVDAAGRFFHAEGADGRLPEELIGKNVWEANPLVIELLKQSGALLALKQDRAQLSALLALPQADDLPRDRAVVHRDGPQRPAREGARSDPRHQVDAGLGRRPHLQHDRANVRTGASRASAPGACRSSFFTATAAASR